jgi:tRNA A37 threonylcarbamoyladenosine dehydratase
MQKEDKMDERFSRTEALIGSEALQKLKNSRVAIFGVGGVGSYALEALVRSGVGEIDLIDSDTVALTNINRQIIANEETVGKYKVEVAEKRAKTINPDVKINTRIAFFATENENEFDFSGVDYVIDAIDTVSSKIALIMKAERENVKIISSMGTGNKLNPLAFEISDIYKTSVCPLARVMRAELKKRGVKKLKVLYSKEEPKKALANDSDSPKTRHAPASIAFVPSVAGLAIAGEVIKDLISE